MNPRALLLLVASCTIAASCADLPPGNVGLGDPCLATTDCVSPYVCISGRCAASPGQLCNPSRYRCNGDYVEQCSATGDAWESQGQCAIACVQGACTEPICVGGTQKCEGNTIMQCLPNGAGWVYVQTCATTCTQDAADARLSVCTAPACTPFQTSCAEGDSSKKVTCNSNGTGWTPSACTTSASSPKTCIQGQCIPQVCTANAQQCLGSLAQACNDTLTAWETKPDGYCQNGCVITNGVAKCATQICVPYATRCQDEGTVETCNSFGTAWIAPTTCATGSTCVSGACRDQICTPGKQRCDDDLVQQCNESGTGWTNIQSCPFSCMETGATTVACAPAACAAGETRCCQPGDASCIQTGGNVLQICTPDRSGFAFVQYCSIACERIQNTSPPKAQCKDPSCPALSQRCNTDESTGASVLEVCSANGGDWVQVEVCSQTCDVLRGGCTRNDTSCTPGEYRCQLDEVQACAQLSDGSLRWEFIDHCFGGCSEGVCRPGGACGCSPAETADTLAQACGGSGVGAPRPIALNLLQSASGSPNSGAAPLPCNDGVTTSTFAVYTAPIVGSDGTKVPDGTMVTFSNDSTSGIADQLIVSADADPTKAGIQRPTNDGVAVVIISAPSQATCQTVNQNVTSPAVRTVTVTAQIAGSCAGTLPIFFAAPTGSGRVNHIAEDFSSTTNKDAAATTGLWDTSISAAGAVPAFSLGTCVDGDFPGNITVPSGAFDLQASTTLMPAWDVASIANQSATVNGVISAVRPGDEVLVATTWGPSGSTGPGTYEFHHVDSVDNTSGFGKVTFTEPVGVVFGNGTNAVLTGHRVILQRVPQFKNVTIPPTTVLTSTAVTASGGVPVGGTGILAFRACGVLSIQNEISMDAKGLPQGLSSLPNTTSTTSLNRFLQGPPAASGSGPTTSGGGVIFITAGTINFTSSSAKVHANGTTGGGGMAWMASPKMNFSSQTRLFATGVTTGMTRIDTSTPDWSLTTPSPTPMTSTQVAYAANGGKVGPVTVQTGRAYFEPSSTGKLVRSAALTGIIGGSGSTSAVFQLASGSTQLIPGVNLSVTSNGYDAPPTWFSLDGGSAVISPLRQPGDVRFRLTLAPTTDKELLVRAVAFSVNVQ